MAAKWNYPDTCTININNAVDSKGYLVTELNDTTPATQKAISFKGFKTPDDDEDANAESSTFKIMSTIIYGLFGLNSGLILNTASATAKAEIEGDFE